VDDEGVHAADGRLPTTTWAPSDSQRATDACDGMFVRSRGARTRCRDCVPITHRATCGASPLLPPCGDGDGDGVATRRRRHGGAVANHRAGAPRARLWATGPDLLTPRCWTQHFPCSLPLAGCAVVWFHWSFFMSDCAQGTESRSGWLGRYPCDSMPNHLQLIRAR
jgi:hypothetical protein